MSERAGAIAWELRNRVSLANLSPGAKNIAETRFLGLTANGDRAVVEKPGFL
ncbi:MAG: hypothetical protein AB4352_02150 [Hormoscilla sp.]